MTVVRRRAHPRVRPGRLAPARLLAAALVALVAGAGCGGPSDAANRPAAPAQSVGTTLDRAVSGSILDLPLRTSTGQATSLRAYAGKVIVLSDMMTLCAETCPLDTANVVDAARAVERAGLGDKVAFLSITVDPRRDTVPQLAAYRRLFTPPPSDWETLTGSPADLARLWKYFGVYYKRVPQGVPPDKNWRTGKPLAYDIEHADLLLFLDHAGHERFVLNGAPHVASGASVPKKLHDFLDEAGLKNLRRSAGFGTWTTPQALSAISWLIGHEIAGSSG
ncbi:MAG: SCO family protein [Nocardioidaceae bacterium]